MTRHAIKNILYSALLILVCAPQALAGVNREKIPAAGLSNIEVNLAKGEVRIMAWNGDHVTVERGKAPIKTTVEKGTLKIGKSDTGGPISNGYLKIYAPEKLNLKVTTKDGKVDIQGFSSRIQVMTMGGDVRVSSCFAPVEIETVGGEIEALDLKGDVSLVTVSGDIHGRNIQSAFFETKSVDGPQFLSDIKARRLRVRSHSGGIELKGAVPKDGLWERSTFDSPIKLGYHVEAALDLEAHSRFGQVRVDNGLEVKERAGNYFRGRLGDGKTLVRLTTFNGNINVALAD